MVALSAIVALGGAIGWRADAGWKAVTIVRRAGAIEASLSFETRRTNNSPAATYAYRAMHLVVRRASRIILDESRLPPVEGQVALGLRNVWGNGDDEALIEIQTGGNTCCSQVEIGVVDGRMGRVLLHNFGMSWRGVRHGAGFDFVSSDDRFYCAFADCASSSEPVQIFMIDVAGDRFIDVTRSRVDVVSRDAAQRWNDFLRSRQKRAFYDPAGALAPWCADEYLLGHRAVCDHGLNYALAHGYLRGWHDGYEGDVQGGRAFVKLLKGALHVWGYG
ncbi:MAG TPA: hypothetical protein VFW41_10360 [Gaiellaceae bacterium]|nr:hypothetical protein [Gaiellaceae bacterium]